MLGGKNFSFRNLYIHVEVCRKKLLFLLISYDIIMLVDIVMNVGILRKAEKFEKDKFMECVV